MDIVLNMSEVAFVAAFVGVVLIPSASFLAICAWLDWRNSPTQRWNRRVALRNKRAIARARHNAKLRAIRGF